MSQRNGYDLFVVARPGCGLGWCTRSPRTTGAPGPLAQRAKHSEENEFQSNKTILLVRVVVAFELHGVDMSAAVQLGASHALRCACACACAALRAGGRAPSSLRCAAPPTVPCSAAAQLAQLRPPRCAHALSRHAPPLHLSRADVHPMRAGADDWCGEKDPGAASDDSHQDAVPAERGD